MIYKRGKVYWYKLMWDGKLVRQSTKQGNDKVARNMESAHRTALAQGLVGIRERRTASDSLRFPGQRFPAVHRSATWDGKAQDARLLCIRRATAAWCGHG